MPDTYYFVKVLAYNAAGEGPESERFIGKLAELNQFVRLFRSSKALFFRSVHSLTSSNLSYPFRILLNFTQGILK